MKIGAAYIRVSDERQDEYSPDSQLKLIREYAKKNDYYVPDEYVYYDDGISGRSVKKRPQFNNMIAAAKDKSHPFSAIFVWKFSRFARNQEESIVYKSLLRKNNVSVISISENIDENNPFGTLIERIIEWMDEYYSIRLSGEVKRGMLEKVSRGEPVCHPAFGYDLVDKKYIPNADSAIVQRIFTEYSEGKGLRKIAKDLGLEGVRTVRGNPPENRWVEYIINNPVYIGKIRWSTDGRAASRRDYDNENIIVMDGNHEAIISEELWNKCQERYKMQKKIYSKYDRQDDVAQFMLKGLLRCSACGSTLVCSVRNQGLQCHQYAKGRCHESHYISIKKINASVINSLKNAVEFKQFPVLPQVQSENTDCTPNYAALIASEELKLKRCKEAYQNGVDTLEEYKDNKNRIERVINKLKAEQEKEESAASCVIDETDYSEKIIDIIQIIESPDVSEDLKNKALKQIIDKIIFDRKASKIDIFFKP